MKESYKCEVATHIGPESCGAAREGGVEALARERTGRVFSRVRQLPRSPPSLLPSRPILRAAPVTTATLSCSRPFDSDVAAVVV
jgi:hypothetical protein